MLSGKVATFVWLVLENCTEKSRHLKRKYGRTFKGFSFFFLVHLRYSLIFLKPLIYLKVIQKTN